MRMIFGLVLLVGLGLAGAAVYITQGYIANTQSQLDLARAEWQKVGPLVQVYVVNKPLAYGDVLTPEDVQTAYLPQNTAPETIFTDPKLLFPDEGKSPRYVLRPMETFEPVLAIKVTEPGEEAGLTARLQKGMRAFAINVDVASGVSGFLMPGDFVDVYWTGAAAGTEGEITQLIEDKVQIIAVDQTADDDRAGSALIARTVTVEATREQVARLAQAQATGRLALSLVGKDDDSMTAAVEVNSRDLLGIEEERVAVTAEQAPVCTVRTRKGAEVVVMEIPCTN